MARRKDGRPRSLPISFDTAEGERAVRQATLDLYEELRAQERVQRSLEANRD